MPLSRNPNRLEVYSETKRRKTYVGELSFVPKSRTWEFKYDKSYLRSKSAIPLGPELSLKRQSYKAKDKLFPSFADRIPSKANPAYEEYCASQGISPTERNQIVLLTTIGKRGPSTFVFEAVYDESDFDVRSELAKVSKELHLSSWDIATAFDLFQLTVQRILNGKSKDRNTLRLIEIFLTFPEVALRQINQTSKKLPGETAAKLNAYFSKGLDESSGARKEKRGGNHNG